LSFAADSAEADFSRRERSAALWIITVDPPRRKKNSQLPRPEVALRLDRVLSGGRRISRVTWDF
jgi:hypothetical protein